MALGAGEKFGATFARDADGRILTNNVGGGTSSSGAALADATANPTTTGQAAYAFVFNGTTWDRARNPIALSGQSASGANAAALAVSCLTYDPGSGTWQLSRTANADAQAGSNMPAVGLMAWNGATSDRLRTPNVFKSFASTAITAGTGATVWTPAGGKKFRLMGWSISSSAAGVLIFGDNAVGTVIARSPAVAAAGVSTLGAADMGNGILSGAADRVLKLDGPTGNVAGMVWGTEE